MIFEWYYLFLLVMMCLGILKEIYLYIDDNLKHRRTMQKSLDKDNDQ